MNHRIRLTTFAGMIALAGLITFSGCDRQGKQKGADKAASEFAPETIGLGADVESLGKDEMGRYWYKGAKGEQWMFDPKDKTLYSASKDEKSGEWKLTAKPEVTAESLGLGAGTEERGKDPNGLYWFVLKGGEEGRVYNPKTKELRRTAKNAKGEWEVGAPVP